MSTDEESYAHDVEAKLAKMGLQKAEAWTISDPNISRLRSEIDPTWFGELPRSYFYDTSHNRQPHSGVLNVEQIKAWQIAIRPKH